MFVELIEKDERTLASRGQHVGFTIAVDIRREDLRAYARVVIDQMRDKLHFTPRLSDQLEPIQDGWRIDCILFRNVSVRPPAFASDNVFQPVSVHIGQRQRMQFGERNSFVRFLPVAAAHLQTPKDRP